MKNVEHTASDIGHRNSEKVVVSVGETPADQAARRHIDPAEEAMQRNPNLSPPITFRHD